MLSRFTRNIAALVVIPMLTACGFTQVSADGTVAIKGYDPVAMRTSNTAVRGADDFSVEVDGFTWKFTGAANRDVFVADVARNAPRFGGYCVTALADGMLVDGDPEAFVMHRDELFLTLGEHARKMFALDPDGMVKRAEANWERLAPMRR